MLYDPYRVGKPVPDFFSRDRWLERGALEERAGGRASVAFLRFDQECWVWRHYRRGGMIAPVLGDLYLYTGAERTRSYREFRLLTELKRRGLPVPAPVAARYERAGALFYRADLITEELEGTETLAHLLTQRKLPAQEWHAIGSTVGSFHLHGVEHADLNAHNILLDSIGRVYVLDFDRGQIRSPGPWHVRVLDRLRRSLEKIRASDPNATYREADWQMLIEGHATTAGTQSP